MEQQWEYAILANCTNMELNEMGLKGWELVTIKADTWWVFKRPRRGTVRLT